VSVDNAHPHRMVNTDGSKVIVGVHNGTVQQPSMTRFNTKKFDVDTQMLYDRLVNDLPTDQIEGTGVLVYMQNESSMRFLRFNSTNLYVARDTTTGGLVWASTKDAVLTAAKRAGVVLSEEIITKPETIYEVQEHDNMHKLVEIGKQKFGIITQNVYTDTTGAQCFLPSRTGYGHGSHKSAICPQCKTLRPRSDGWGLCVVCQDISLTETNSYYENTYVYVGHYIGPTEPDPTPTKPPTTGALAVPQTLSSVSTTDRTVLDAYELMNTDRPKAYKFGQLLIGED